MKKLLTISTILLFFSCAKKEEIKTEKKSSINSEKTIADNLENDKKSLFNLLSKFENQSQFFNISSSKPSIVKGKKGTIIHIVPSNLELENGNKITGKIKVELKELINQKDLLKNNVQTVSNGKLLISGGSYYIDITSNGNKVNLKKGKTLEVEFPKITNRNMELFYGQRDSLNQMNWEIANKKISSKKLKITDTKEDAAPNIYSEIDDLLAYTENGEDNIPKKDIKKINEIDDTIYQSINLSKLGWINCDAFYNNQTENTIITFQETNKLSFVKSFIIFKDMNSVMNLYTFKNSKLQSHIKLPLNQKIKIISFSYKEEKFYASEKEVTISKNNPIEINLKEVSENDIEKLFKI